MNPNQNENLAKTPKHAIISLKNERETPYKKYLNVYNELKQAYNELWEEEANKRFNKPYKNLTLQNEKKLEIRYLLLYLKQNRIEIE